MHNSKHSGSGAATVAMIGAGIAALAAGYFFLGPKGKEHQKHAKAWAIKMKGEVVEKLEMAKDITEPIYHEIIDTVADEYKKGMKAGHQEVDSLAVDLKKHWKTIALTAMTAKHDVVKSAKKVAKRAKL